MIKTFMLLLAFTVTDPFGEELPAKVHVLSRHFDTQLECKQFVDTWEDTIRDRGLESVQSMLADGWGDDLTYIGCTLSPILE